MIPYKILRLFPQTGTYNLVKHNDDKVMCNQIVTFFIT